MLAHSLLHLNVHTNDVVLIVAEKSLILTKMNADSFRSEMESKSNWMSGGVGITNEVLAFARDIGMHPEILRLMKKKTWMVSTFFFFFFNSNQQPNSQYLNFLRKQTRFFFL